MNVNTDSQLLAGKKPEQLYSIPEAARMLGGISKWTIYTWFRQGKLRRTKVGDRTMIRESELVRIINQGENDAAQG